MHPSFIRSTKAKPDSTGAPTASIKPNVGLKFTFIDHEVDHWLIDPEKQSG